MQPRGQAPAGGADKPTKAAIAEATDQLDRALFLTYRENMDAEPRSRAYLERAATPRIPPKKRRTSMSPRSDRFRGYALTAERAASVAADPEVKVKFADIASSWHSLAAMVDRGKVVDMPRLERAACS
jgi:ribosomal protein S30